MPLLFPGPHCEKRSESESWARRVSENIRQLLDAMDVPRSETQLSPVQFHSVDLSTAYGWSQPFSMFVHIVLAGLGLLVLTLPTSQLSPGQSVPVFHLRRTPPDFLPPPDTLFGRNSMGRSGGGGAQDPLPTKKGLLAPSSSIALVPPRIPEDHEPALPEPPAVCDANSPAEVRVVTNLGLPWMKDDSNSAGPGRGQGWIGRGRLYGRRTRRRRR
jgi:hypothetical protein